MFPVDGSTHVPGCSRGEVNDTGITMTRSEHEPGDSDGERETPRARAAGIDEENALTLFDERPVGVTGKHCREPSGCGLETELPEVMNHVGGHGTRPRSRHRWAARKPMDPCRC